LPRLHFVAYLGATFTTAAATSKATAATLGEKRAKFTLNSRFIL